MIDSAEPNESFGHSIISGIIVGVIAVSLFYVGLSYYSGLGYSSAFLMICIPLLIVLIAWHDGLIWVTLFSLIRYILIYFDPKIRKQKELRQKEKELRQKERTIAAEKRSKKAAATRKKNAAAKAKAEAEAVKRNKLKKLKKAELQQVAIERGLDPSGTKDELRHRIEPSIFYDAETLKQMRKQMRKITKEIEKEEEIERKKRSRHIPQDVKNNVWRRDEGKCTECGSNEDLEFDHIIPHSKGGANSYRNIQLLCEKCNRKKSSTI